MNNFAVNICVEAFAYTYVFNFFNGENMVNLYYYFGELFDQDF